jgi:GTP-binding protein EngB required for normal cell division
MESENRQLNREAKTSLNDSQRLRLRVSCQYIDQLLAEIESILHSASSRSPFSKYVGDLSLPQAGVIEEYIAHLRAQLVRSLEWQHIRQEAPSISASHAILTHLSFIDIAVEELRPRYMRGSGPIEEPLAGELNGVVHQLRSLVDGLTHFLRQEHTNVEARLERLRQGGADVSLLASIADIIARHGLIEFRERVESIEARLEDQHFEIAFFGRVSSGKSSLLNALMGADILPVGIHPITAVPTRLQSGSKARAIITFADGRPQQIPLEEIAQFVTEEHNPGNSKNVIKAVAEFPSARLREGVVLVDTPGLGSLARHGARETLAYLPSADLAAVLIDAGSTLQEEDIATVRLLEQAGIPALILLSKADLLEGDDIEGARVYLERQLTKHLGAAPPIHLVSARRDHVGFLNRFYSGVLVPIFEQAAALRTDSLARKTGVLREAIARTIETLLNRRAARGRLNEAGLADLETNLRNSIGKVGEQPRIFERELLQLEESCDSILEQLARRAFDSIYASGATRVDPEQLAQWLQELVGAQLSTPVADLRLVFEEAVSVLQEVAASLELKDAPAANEVSSAFRNLPRFEFAGMPVVQAGGPMALLGKKAVLARLRSQLSKHARVQVQHELRAYGRAVHRWVQETTRQSQQTIRSYADGYRVQIQRLMETEGAEKTTTDLDPLRQDLLRLRETNPQPASSPSR